MASMNTYYRGRKAYELTNHLGNVLVTVSDRKIPAIDTVQYYLPDVISATDYYPFGSPMPGRSFSAEKYRFGFQNQEKLRKG